ncbi:MAG: hypothetical protein DMC60_13045 [Verrucomicrobia bacterium]|nr:MAG: hypothetical protein DMC60_13045 [Verrucomicrobiota bacterium]
MQAHTNPVIDYTRASSAPVNNDNESQRVASHQAVDWSCQSVRRRLAATTNRQNGLNNAEPIGLALISCSASRFARRGQRT